MQYCPPRQFKAPSYTGLKELRMYDQSVHRHHPPGAEEFQTLLTLARACAVSFGEAKLSPERWEHLKGLEAKRQARLRVV